mmetsp:Transcript_22654/g.22500  ORF Transcript_22654/g.22500 Transcript_22654/m.22500 type:complete len:205 (-) Transcript_22654:179-793(-)
MQASSGPLNTSAKPHPDEERKDTYLPASRSSTAAAPANSFHEEAKIASQMKISQHDSLRKIESFGGKKGKGGRKKGKKGIKWEKADNTTEMLGFESQNASPFELDSGYNINELDLMHFTDRPVKRRAGKNVKFSSSQHIQANHRFILKPTKDQDYFFATYDPDYKVEWEEIFMVLAKRNADYLCPICREEKMVVPVISQCGHIF